MSVVKGFGINGKSYYTNVAKPSVVHCNFIVDSTNANGLGIRSLKSNGYVRNVFMHTSQTPGANDGVTNPNPAAGYGIIQMTNNFNYYLGGFSGFVSPNSATLLTSTTAGSPYVISSAGSAIAYVFTVTSASATQGATYTTGGHTYTVLATISGSTTLRMSATTTATLTSGTLTKASGTGDSTITFSAATGGAATTAAQWVAAGLQPGLTATAGQSFIAAQTAQIGGSAQVVAPSVSGISSVEVIGDPNQSIANASTATYGGAYVLVQFLGGIITLDSYTPVGTVAAPTFTGDALATHVHDFLVKGGQASATTNRIANYSGPLIGKEEATDATYAGANSATRGGVVAVTAGTPSGTNSAPAFTGTAHVLTGSASFSATAPTNGSVVAMTFYFDGSSVTVDGI